MRKVSLEGVRLYAYHGLFPEENIKGNDFQVDLCVTLDAPSLDTNVEELEAMENSISYADLYEIVKMEMSHTRKLLETVVHLIVKRIAERYPEVKGVKCKITKMRPPIPDFEGAASVSLSWVR